MCIDGTSRKETESSSRRWARVRGWERRGDQGDGRRKGGQEIYQITKSYSSLLDSRVLTGDIFADTYTTTRPIYLSDYRREPHTSRAAHLQSPNSERRKSEVINERTIKPPPQVLSSVSDSPAQPSPSSIFHLTQASSSVRRCTRCMSTLRYRPVLSLARRPSSSSLGRNAVRKPNELCQAPNQSDQGRDTTKDSRISCLPSRVVM